MSDRAARSFLVLAIGALVTLCAAMFGGYDGICPEGDAILALGE